MDGNPSQRFGAGIPKAVRHSRGRKHDLTRVCFDRLVANREDPPTFPDHVQLIAGMSAPGRAIVDLRLVRDDPDALNAVSFAVQGTGLNARLAGLDLRQRVRGYEVRHGAAFRVRDGLFPLPTVVVSPASCQRRRGAKRTSGLAPARPPDFDGCLVGSSTTARSRG